MGDVGWFDFVSPVYDLVMPSVDGEAVERGLGRAERRVDRVVDLGGGTGRAVRVVDASTRVVVDASRGMLMRADAERVLGDARESPLRGSSVDAVLVVDALHHIGRPSVVGGEAFRVLREGGVVVVCDFDPGSLQGRLLAFGERLLGMGSEFYSPGEVVDVLDGEGFDAGVVREGFGYVVVGVKRAG